MGVDYNCYTGLLLKIKDSKVVSEVENFRCSNNKCKNHSGAKVKSDDKFCSTCGSPIEEFMKKEFSNFSLYDYRNGEYEDLFYIPEYYPSILMPNEYGYSLFDSSFNGGGGMCEITEKDILDLKEKIKNDKTIMKFMSDFKDDFPDNDIKIKFATLMYTS